MPHLVKKLKCQIITSCYDSFKNLNWHVSFLWLLLALRVGVPSTFVSSREYDPGSSRCPSQRFEIAK